MTEGSGNKMYQAATLQSLMMGYTRKVVTVGELLTHGEIGLGTFEDVNGEMIVLDGVCYRAGDSGKVDIVSKEEGVPFAAVARVPERVTFSLEGAGSIEELKTQMDVKIEEQFGLNSMHAVRLDGVFARVKARSESAFRSQHVILKEILADRQKDFVFENVSGTIVGLYFPDYMGGINACGWHFHFISEDRTCGGHVFDVEVGKVSGFVSKIGRVEIQLPMTPAFDTYTLNQVSQADVKKVE